MPDRTTPSERQAQVLWTAVTALAVAILIALSGLILWGLGWLANHLSSVLLPLAVAGILAYVLDPVVDFFERRSHSRMRAIWMVFALAVLIMIGLGATVLPRLISEVETFASQVPTYVVKVRERVNSLLQHPPKWLPNRLLHPNPALPPGETGTNTPNSELAVQQTNTPAATPVAKAGSDTANATSNDKANTPEGANTNAYGFGNDLSGQLFAWAAKSLPKVGFWVVDQISRVASVASLLAGLALVPVYLFYFLLEKRGIQKGWRDFLPLRESQMKDELAFVLSSINDCLIVFFRGQVLVALCVGTLLTLGFTIVGLNFALLLGVMAGVLGIVPYLGVAVSLIPAVVISIAQFGDWWHPVAVLGVFATTQILEGFVISPRIIGDRVGLHPLTIIIAVMVGTTLLGGVLGGVLAIPLTAVLRTLMFRYVWTEARTRNPNPQTVSPPPGS